MRIYVVVVQDRHVDVDMKLFVARDAAIAFARATAKDNCRHAEDYLETNVEGWLFYARYSCEGDCVIVITRELEDAQGEAMPKKEALDAYFAGYKALALDVGVLREFLPLRLELSMGAGTCVILDCNGAVLAGLHSAVDCGPMLPVAPHLVGFGKLFVEAANALAQQNG